MCMNMSFIVNLSDCVSISIIVDVSISVSGNMSLCTCFQFIGIDKFKKAAFLVEFYGATISYTALFTNIGIL